MKLPCCIVIDLLPLFIEDMDGKESHRLVAEHLQECETCRAEAAMLKKDFKPVTSGVRAFDSVRKKLRAKKTAAVTAFFLIVTVLAMFPSWFGEERGVQEIKGTVVLFHPVTLVCMLAVLASLWIKREKMQNLLRICGFAGIVGIELYTFLTWPPVFNISKSFQMVYPEFYIGFFLSCIAFVWSIVQARSR